MMLAQGPPQEGALNRQIKEWTGKFVQLKVALFQARGDLEQMARKAPPDIRPEIVHLQKRQGELEQRFFDVEGRLISMAQAYGYPIPGLSWLADNPVSLVASAARLYWDATAHIQKVADYRARIGGGITSPALPSGGSIKTYLPWALGAFILWRFLR